MNPLYFVFTIFTGGILSVMIVVNGSLGAVTGLLLSSVVIHLVGLVGSTALTSMKKELPFRHKKAPLCLYAGGASGVATVLLFNAAYGGIPVTALVAFGLLGQALSSLIVDQIGFLGMKKRPLAKGQIPGILVALAGIFIMSGDFTGSSLIPVTLALLTGLTVVLSRTINGALSKVTSPSLSTWYNHFVGLWVSLVLFAAAGFPGQMDAGLLETNHLWLLTGGLMGVIVVTASNFLIHHVSSYSMTLLLFIGQIFTGVFLDHLLTGIFSPAQFLSGTVLAAGFALNAWASSKNNKAAG